MKKKVFITLTVLGCLALSSCSQKKSDAKLQVIAATFPCYDAARAILGSTLSDGTASLKMLVKPGSEVHSFDPTPSEIISLKNSDLFIYVGGESDSWIEKLNLNLHEEKKLALFDHVNLLNENDFEGKKDFNPNEEDEHIWTSPSNEVLIVQAIFNALCKTKACIEDSSLINKFAINAYSYINEILQTDLEIKNILNEKQNKFILMADRFPFTYFAEYYGLEHDAAFNGCSTAVEASTNTISRLVDEIKAKKIPCVFYIELSNHKIADSIAESTGTKTVMLHSIQNVTKDDFTGGATWVSLMKRNAEALKNLN